MGSKVCLLPLPLLPYSSYLFISSELGDRERMREREITAPLEYFTSMKRVRQ
jgi:hypothetical protein